MVARRNGRSLIIYGALLRESPVSLACAPRLKVRVAPGRIASPRVSAAGQRPAHPPKKRVDIVSGATVSWRRPHLDDMKHKNTLRREYHRTAR